LHFFWTLFFRQTADIILASFEKAMSVQSEKISSVNVDNEIFEVTDDFYFRTPSFLYLSGASYSGKTEFILKLIENHQRLFIPNLQRVVFVYAENQPSLFERVKKANPDTVFVEGLSQLQSKVEFSSSLPTLLILDDVAHESSTSEYVLQLAVRESHHKAITVIYVQHNLFQQNKYSKTISLQSKYMVLFKNPRDMNQYKYLGNQIFGHGGGKILVQVFRDISEGSSYPHLIIDLHPESNQKLCLISNLFPADNTENPGYPIAHQINFEK
jgi:hypothetical protein